MEFQRLKNNNCNSGIPEEVLELLPWYAIGKLSVDDQTFFDKALLKYTLLEKQLKQELQLIKTVSTDKSLLDLSIISTQEERLKSVFNMIDIQETQEQAINHNRSSASNSLLEKLKNAFGTLIPNQVSVSNYARLASVGLLILSVGILTTFITPVFTKTSDFIPASAISKPINEQPTTLLLVGFNGTSIQLGSNDVLKDKLLKIEAAPEGAGIYQISFKKILSPEEVRQTLDALQKQQELIWFAGEAF